jgi:hypothetical protein
LLGSRIRSGPKLRPSMLFLSLIHGLCLFVWILQRRWSFAGSVAGSRVVLSEVC